MENQIQRSKFAVNILVDCCSFISEENKLFNMMLICALTQALDSLDIPYSVAVVADQNFKVIVKDFTDLHCAECLQRICDCLLIKRSRTKLASSIEFAINNMKYKKDEKKEQNEERPYRAIFVFSDGLDDQLALSKSWNDKLLTDANLSIGFVFIESVKLQGDDLKYVEGFWKTFESEVNIGNSIVKIAPIRAQISYTLLNNLTELFVTVMNRNPDKNSIDFCEYADINFSVNQTLSDVTKLEFFLKADYSKIKSFFIGSTQVLKNANSAIDKLNPNKYSKHLRSITKCKSEISIYDFMKKFIISRRNIEQSSLETIFKPNKANQYLLSTTGTDFDIIALVLYLINPTPEPMIYLEQTGGMIRNYAVTIVVDPSYSCFDNLSGPHSLQTIQTILSSLASLDLNCFDLIVAGSPNPTILCSEVGTINALSNKSTLFDSLFSILQDPHHNVDLSSAIHAAFDLKRMRYSDCTSILFVLTNGLYDGNDCKKIINSVNMCVQSGISTFGIGIGIYPKGIEKLFPQVIFSPNPSNVMKAVASFYSDSMSSLLPKMIPISFPPPKDKELTSIFQELINKPIFTSLRDELMNNISYTLEAFDDMYNEEIEMYDDQGNVINPIGVNTELYVKDLLKSQKILIVMLWDYSMNPEYESPFVNKAYINEPSEPDAGCIKTAVDHFGITLKIVQNYEDAINELTKQTTPGFCDYYAVWVFCGPPYRVLPEKNKDPDLVNQFNEVLILFWKNGGSIVFWAEGDPLTYQANLFFETAEFQEDPNSKPEKTALRIGGEHIGKQILTGEVSDVLSNIKTFNRSPRFFKLNQRTKLSHNIRKIFEGITISYAEYGTDIKPFIPFARDSEGGICAMFYPANTEIGTGDIVVDCGFTKCFTQMKTEGTFRYVQNIAGWTARPEIHISIDKVQPRDWRPKAVEFKIRKGEKWNGFQEEPEEIDSEKLKTLKTLWAIDSSESVLDNDFYHTELNRIVNEYSKDGDEFYLWDNNYRQININELRQFINNRGGYTGTKPDNIAKIIERSNIREHLLIVTDGSVFSKDIDISDDLMKKNKIVFKFVTTFVILNETDPDIEEFNRQTGQNIKIEADLSVGAPYSRKCQSITYSIQRPNERVEMASLSPRDMKALQNINNINTIEQFNEHFINLDRVIQAAMIGKNKNTDLVNKIDLLYQRLSVNLGKNQLDDFKEKICTLRNMANGSLREAFTRKKVAAAKREQPLPPM